MGSSSSIWFGDASLWSRVGERRLRNNVNGAASRFGLTIDCERVVVLWLLIGRDQCGIAYITKQVPRSSLSECVALAKKWFRFTGFSSEQLLRQVVTDFWFTSLSSDPPLRQVGTDIRYTGLSSGTDF